ncbi:MAG TPA: nuclear transport factor 2 family protein, partial [Chloroflexia bacterium]|nr:nuclear transport factor 2 family protein [Chloroflexia bacterium]
MQPLSPETSTAEVLACVHRLQQAINDHDLEAMTACFEPEYPITFPVHPDRLVGGHARMRQTWAQI